MQKAICRRPCRNILQKTVQMVFANVGAEVTAAPAGRPVGRWGTGRPAGLNRRAESRAVSRADGFAEKSSHAETLQIYCRKWNRNCTNLVQNQTWIYTDIT